MKADYSKLFYQRPDGRYQAHWIDEEGKRHILCDRDPQRLHDRLIEAMKPLPATFREVATAWEETHVEKLSRGTQKTYRAPIDKLNKALGSKPIASVTASDLSMLLQREKTAGKSYKNAALLRSIFKQICDFAIGRGDIASNPALAVRVPAGMHKGHVEAPSESEEEIIKANLDKPFGDFVALLLYTGMRTEEAVALTWEDVNFKKELITINKAMDLHGTPKLKETKTEAGERVVPILPPLKRYLIKPTKASGYVFNVDGKPLTRGQINSRWLNWCKAAGLAEQKRFLNRHRGTKECIRTEWRPIISPHQLRHYFSTILYENKIDLLTAQRLMGHKDIETTQRIYTSLRNRYLEGQFDALKDAFK